MANESFIRWQRTTIEQLGYAVNTLLVMAVATIGFCLDQLLGNKICYCCSYYMILVGLVVLVICVFDLLLLTLNRLIDFRNTAKIARLRSEDSNDELEDLRNYTKALGDNTWRLLYVGIGLFALGYIFIITGFAISILK